MKHAAIVSFFVLYAGIVGVVVIPVASARSIISVQGNLTLQTADGTVGASMALDGSQSVDDGTARSFAWRQIKGPSVSLSSTSSVQPTFTPTVADTYVFELMVADSYGNMKVVQRSTFTVGNDAPQAARAGSTPPPGDPDFDLLRVVTPLTVPIADADLDIRAETALTVTNEGRDRSQVMNSAAAESNVIVGDPDFDLLNIGIGGSDLAELRVAVSAGGEIMGTTVRGWDPKNKEEIVNRPDVVRTSADLQTYVEAVALNDEALTDIKIRQDDIEISSRESGKLFWLFPIEMLANVIVKFDLKDSTGDAASVRLPWWHVFVKKNYDPAALKTELDAALAARVQGDVTADVSPQDTVRNIAETLQVVSNAMKVKHDASISATSNIQ